MNRRELLRLAAAAALAGAAGRAAAAAAQPFRLLILGGTSFLGPHLTEQALARGWQVSHFNRGKRMPDGMPGVEQLLGDRDGQLDALKGGRWDAVVDTSGYVPRHVRLSAELLAPATQQYVFISTISVYASLATPAAEDAPVGRLADESVEQVNGETYGPLKALCEQAAGKAMPGRTTVIRPGLIVGPRDPTDRFTYWPVRAARGGEFIAPGTPEDPLQVIDVRDLAALTLKCIDDRRMQVMNAVSTPRLFTMGKLMDACVEVAANGAKPVWIPAEFLAEHGVAPWSDMPAWFPPAGEEAAGALTPVDRALAAGMAIRPLVESVRDTLAWHATRPPERRGKLRAGLDAAREAAVLAAWHAKNGGA
jgi:2'-hydroxyisoflavone reductase